MTHHDDAKSVPVAVTPAMTSVPHDDDQDTAVENAHQGPFAHLGSARKGILLAVFALATAIDVLNISALLILTPEIAADLDLRAGNVTWIIVAYTLTFAGFLLFSGRLADIFPAQFVFLGGFGALGVLLLISSFLNNKYAFLVLRALQGLVGSMTIPSAYHLIVHLYTEKNKQQAAIAMIGLVAGISNSLGIVLGGLFDLGDASWRWLLRFLAMLSLAAFGVGAILLPLGNTIRHTSRFTKLQRLDIGGAVILTSSLCLFILGLTSGTTDGWTSAKFLAPFILSLFLFTGFWVWESFQHDERAMLPIGLMRSPNLILLCFAALTPFLWWGTIQFEHANVWQTPEYGYTPILVAARLLPMGLTGFVAGTMVHLFPVILRKPKYTVLAGYGIAIAPGTILLIFSDGGRGNDYWKYSFPSFFIGSLGMFFAFLALQVSIIQALPPSASGVAGGLLQIFLQIGSVIGLSVAAGLFSRVDNNFADWRGSQYYMYFDIAWVTFTMLMLIIFWRRHDAPPAISKSPASDIDDGDHIAMTKDITGAKAV